MKPTKSTGPNSEKNSTHHLRTENSFKTHNQCISWEGWSTKFFKNFLLKMRDSSCSMLPCYLNRIFWSIFATRWSWWRYLIQTCRYRGWCRGISARNSRRCRRFRARCRSISRQKRRICYCWMTRVKMICRKIFLLSWWNFCEWEIWYVYVIWICVSVEYELTEFVGVHIHFDSLHWWCYTKS